MRGSDQNDPPSVPPPWPRRVTAAFGSVFGRGDLSISPGRITFRPRRLLVMVAGRGEVVHELQEVLLVHARFQPPWMNRHIFLSDVPGRSPVLINVSRDRGLLRDLQSAGFRIRTTHTWFTRWGGSGSQPGPSD